MRTGEKTRRGPRAAAGALAGAAFAVAATAGGWAQSEPAGEAEAELGVDGQPLRAPLLTILESEPTSIFTMAMVFTGELVAFEGDVADVYVEDGFDDQDVTVRCRVTGQTQGIEYFPETAGGFAEMLEFNVFVSRSETPLTERTRIDEVQARIGETVTVAPQADETCAQFSFQE